MLHESSVDWLPITGAPYRPTQVLAPGQSATVDVSASNPWNDTGLYLNAGDYQFTAEGAWLDAWITSGPEGTTGPRRFIPLTEGLRPIGTLLGQAEKVLRLVTRNQAINVFFTRREEGLPWMSLVGVVANDAIPLKNGRHAHERIDIGAGAGAGADHRVTKDGYLYAFANDAWGYYGHNWGDVRLTVTRKPAG